MNSLRRLISGRRYGGHSRESEEFTFENLEAADRIVVTTNLNETIKTLDDAAIIQAVLAFVKSHGSGWTVPAEGVPIARLRLNFYQAGTLLGNVGVGKTFLSALQLGSFWSKTSDEAQRARILDIIGLED